MKRRNKILFGVGIVVLLVAGFFIFFPFFLAPPLPLYHIENKDVDNHEVVIELFDPHNKSIIKEKCVLESEECAERPKPFLLKFTWPEGKYTFKVTLDSEIAKTYEAEMYYTLMVVIGLYHGKVNPIISMGVVVV